MATSDEDAAHRSAIQFCFPSVLRPIGNEPGTIGLRICSDTKMQPVIKPCLVHECLPEVGETPP